MLREAEIENLEKDKEWDFVIIGGGASGLGTAVDAASRGFKTVLFEGVDFAKGTSSRSTKLVHGGVRYLAQGDIGLVKEALEERGLIAKNARHLFKNQNFIIPNYNWWGGYYYAIGLKIYDWLSKGLSLGKSKLISKNETIRNIPSLKTEKLRSGVAYHDGQFDDARLAINLAQTANEQGATIINYMRVVNLIKDKDEKVVGVVVLDTETNQEYNVKSKVVVNATGIFTNSILKMNDPKQRKMVVPSQGVHLVLDSSFLNSEMALMIPKTSDGRVLFAIPWHGKTVVGTTDTLVQESSLEPEALEEEIDFILETAALYLTKKPERKDVLSVFAGLRPLAAPKKEGTNTKEVSRSHKIHVTDSKLITIIGGKWTTYRKIAEDIVDKAIEITELPNLKCKTKDIGIHGSKVQLTMKSESHLAIYGDDAVKIEALKEQNIGFDKKIHPNYSYEVAEVVWGIRKEMARTVEDILARRIRMLFLDARAAIEAASIVAEILAKELNLDKGWEEQQVKDFVEIAKKYTLN